MKFVDCVVINIFFFLYHEYLNQVFQLPGMLESQVNSKTSVNNREKNICISKTKVEKRTNTKGFLVVFFFY